MKNKELFENVKKLNLPHGKYALFGGAQLGIKGLRGCHDIDIVVTEGLFNEYKNKSEWEMKKTPHGSESLLNNNIELLKDWKPGDWNTEQLIQEAEIIDGLPFVKIEHVIKWKKIRGEEKDLRDIEMLENYFKK